MDEQPDAPTPAPVKDRREVPRGVLPRRFQTWLMAGLALGIVLIVLLTGHPEPPARPSAAPAIPPPPNADRVRDYQEQLRVVEERMAREAQAAAAQPPPPRAEVQTERQVSAPEDAIAADRRRREYESCSLATWLSVGGRRTSVPTRPEHRARRSLCLASPAHRSTRSPMLWCARRCAAARLER